jgi:uncharacterized membrane-anchored protein YitT (DUF2179 family)
VIKRVAALPGRVLRNRPIRDFLLVTLGAVITAWSLDSFLIPNKIAAGGVSGLATVVYHVGLERGVTIPVGVQMLVMNLVLLGIGIRARGWRYGAKTIYGAVALSVAVDVMAPFVPNMAPDSELLAVLYGGALAGLGLGLVFKTGANTGGVDIIAQLLVSKVPLGIGQVMLVIDGVVIAIAGLVFGPELALWAFIAVFVAGRVIDLVQEGLAVTKAAFVITDKSDDVARAILFELDRGATGLAGRGLYSGTEREVILVVVSRNELGRLKMLVKAVDPDAFLIVTDVHEAVGEGFKEIGAHHA